MKLQDFRYELPDVLIAREPLAERTASRLLVVGDQLEHRRFSDLRGLLRPGDLLVLNDTQVLKARLRGEKDSGGKAEVLVERLLDDSHALCQVRVSKPLKPGRKLSFAGYQAEVVGRRRLFYELRFEPSVMAVLDEQGEVPLPPYMERAPKPEDEQRYQTVFGSVPGAVAAPTAGLHFDEPLLAALGSDGIGTARVTLHVGAGTFLPVRVDDIEQHEMHFEAYSVPETTSEMIRETREAGGRIVAVGTTVVRTLESAFADGVVQPGSNETNLFITPGYRFNIVDALVTNFHLPESTLLMLVSAFAGYERVMAAYAAAVEAQYRFFSYGDAMFLERSDV